MTKGAISFVKCLSQDAAALAHRSIKPCEAWSIPRPARRQPGPFEKGRSGAVGIDLLALLRLEI